jgi:acetyltransferase-like isoleucine patch superfamily enzyme
MWVRAAYLFAHLGNGVSIPFTCDLHNTRLIAIGDRVTFHNDVWLHAHATSANAGKPVITIGDRCFIGRRSHIAGKNSIYLERNVLLAANVLIQDHGHRFTDIDVPIRDQGSTAGGTIRICEGTWIGQGAAIICESGELTIGRNCVIGANAVVTRSAPEHSVLSGNPARIVKQFDESTHRWVLGSGPSLLQNKY